MLTIFRLGMSAALAFAKRLNLSQIALIVLAALLAIQTARVAMEKRHSGKLRAQVEKLAGELQRISTAKAEQREATARNIDRAVNHGRQADKAAKVIEAAPLPGSCRTPAEILESPDL